MTSTNPEPKMSLVNILRVSLVNLAVALLTLPLGSTLNRVMVTELALPATLVAGLLALGNLTSPLRIWFGRLSDTRPIAGRRRTWYIALGVALMTLGLIAAPFVIFTIPTLGAGGLLLTFLAFVLIGLGINSTTPLYFALVSDQANETQRPRIVAFMFVLLGVGVVIGAFVLGALLEPFSPERLNVVILGVAAVSVLLAVLGLAGLEPKNSRAQSQKEASFDEVRRLLTENREVLRFFVYLLLTFVAIDAQDVILEPFAAAAFGMTPGESAALTGILRSGFLLTLIAGAFLVNRFGHKVTANAGIAVAVVSFVLLIASGGLGLREVFMGAVFVLGLGNGLLATANLSLMMNMTDPSHAGVYIGTWGFAQAVGVGSAALVGGILRDAAFAFTGNNLLSYFTVFGLEIVLLLIAVPLLLRLDVRRFRETSERLSPTQALAAASD
jgi:BCD family chlorophyll transporter-like MFS transporter